MPGNGGERGFDDMIRTEGGGVRWPSRTGRSHRLARTGPIGRARENPAEADVSRKEGKGEGPFGPPRDGTGRPTTQGVTLGESTVLSDTDTPIWRNRESLRVRLTEENSSR